MREKVLLVVDDEESICTLFENSLKNWAKTNSVRIITSSTMKGAYEAFENESLDIRVLITDQYMPEITGTELIKSISVKYPDIVDVLMTGLTGIEDIEEIIDAGLFAFLKKPCDRKKIIDTADRALKYSQLRADAREQERLLTQDLKIASEFQQVFLKVPIPESPYMDVEYFFMLGDVAGHGLKASFFTAILKAIIFSEYIKNNKSVLPSDFLEWLNRRLFTVLRNTPDLFIAFSACLLKAKEKKAYFTNAGQPPFLIVSGGNLVKKAETEIAIGVYEETIYSDTEIVLESGDLVVMCTDGIYPAGKNTGSGTEKEFEDMLVKNAHLVSGFNERLMDHVYQKETAGGIFDDDSTIMTIRIR